jgi:hypothetical protein
MHGMMTRTPERPHGLFAGPAWRNPRFVVAQALLEQRRHANTGPARRRGPE